MTTTGMVVVGAGEAGTRAALTLREAGFDGAITLVGGEAHAPYERPPLSKAALVGDGHPEATWIATEQSLADAQVEFRHGCHATSISRAERMVRCDDGRALPYARLLLATGARPRKLDVPGADVALYLRSLTDARTLWGRLRPRAHLVVVGGGFIGLEVAATAIARGCRVTLLEAGPRVLGRGVPEPIAAWVAARHVAAGVDLRVGVAIERFNDHVVVLADRTEIACDCIVAGVGATPDVELAAQAGLAVENGIRVDATLRTSDDAIYAAGDCCSYPAALYDGTYLRLEAWRNAQSQGEAAARNMLGDETAFDAVPWFWSDQYDETIQVAGVPGAGPVTVARETPAGLLFFHLAADGRLVAASGVGPLSLSKDIRIAEMLIARRVRPDPAQLAAPTVRLRTLLAA